MIKPAAERVTLDADTLFDFDKAVLRPAGRAALDDSSPRQGSSPEVIMAVAMPTASVPMPTTSPFREGAAGSQGLPGQQRHRTESPANRGQGRDAAVTNPANASAKRAPR